MKIIVGMATMKGREKSCEVALNSLKNQVDTIYLYDNESMVDLTDNGKFYGLKLINESCYYFSCDDDILYPKDYIEKTIKSIEEHKTIVTYHGRIILGTGLNYYRGHKTFRCLNDVYKDELIDVAGTGVTAFRTDYFKPKIHNSKDKKMSDLVFSLEAKKQNKKITVLKHQSNWIKQLDVDHSKSIHATEQGNLRQNKIADEIFKLKSIV